MSTTKWYGGTQGGQVDTLRYFELSDELFNLFMDREKKQKAVPTDWYLEKQKAWENKTNLVLAEMNQIETRFQNYKGRNRVIKEVKAEVKNETLQTEYKEGGDELIH
jgi:hypothetical protein